MRLPSITVNQNRVALYNLTIIVGSNGVGKTTFLRDLYNEFISKRPNGDSANRNRMSNAKWHDIFNGEDASTLTEWKKWLQSLEVVTGESTNNQPVYAIPKSLGREQKPQKITQQDKDAATTYIDSSQASVDGLSNSWSHIFRDQQTSFLSVDNRFYVSNNYTGQLNPDTSNNLQPAPFLAINEDVLRKINMEMQKLFGKKVFVESPLYPTYNLLTGSLSTRAPKRVSTTPNGLLKQKAIYDEWQSSNTITNLSEEGHGVRAAFEILYSLKIDENKVIFIDEPEIHLYPSSKYQLGKIIGDYAKSSRRQIILSTHDTEMLRGLLSAGAPTTILKIKRNRSLVSIAKNRIRNTVTSDALQSAFLDAVIVTEGVTDQFVYRNVFMQRKMLQSKGKAYSYEVVAVNGKESIADDFDYYKALDINFVAILDYDALFDSRRGGLIKHCLQKIGATKADTAAVQLKIDNINTETKDITGRKHGIRAIGLTNRQKQNILDVIDGLKKFGIFIVPTGGLEGWVGIDQHIPPEIIYNKYRSSANKKYKALSDFTQEINSYLAERIR